jgi:hypothetical protein
MKNDRIKNDRIKSDRMKSDRIKSDRIKTDRIKSITDPTPVPSPAFASSSSAILKIRFAILISSLRDSFQSRLQNISAIKLYLQRRGMQNQV